MKASFPRILSSQKTFYWTLPAALHCDAFSFQSSAPAALLLLGMHIKDPLPWMCARNPVEWEQEPALLDLECKRILGKRYRLFTEDHSTTPNSSLLYEPIDTIAVILKLLKSIDHNFLDPNQTLPQLIKVPGKLLPRHLFAQAEIRFSTSTVKLYSRNFSELSQCLHAELSLLFALSEMLRGLPPENQPIRSFHLHSTLKPCKMCAAFLHLVRGFCQSFDVSFDEHDPGKLASDTLLDRYGYRSHL